MSSLSNIVKNVSRRLAGYAGGVLLSKKIYRQILRQRKNAIDSLLANERVSLRPGLACVVFSKDRPLQLFTLLYTYFDKVRNPAPVTIIYDVSNQDYANAYVQVAQHFLDRSVSVSFVRQGNSFRETLIGELNNVEVSAIFFLVDDIVFIRPVDLSITHQIDPLSAMLSLRHSPHLRRSYTGNARVKPPKFSASAISPELVQFQWFDRGYEWSDPWSVDGHVLSTAELRVLTRISEFQAPNTYEVALKAFNDIAEPRLGLCFRESKILNLPINRVQSEIPNLSGSISCAYLLEQWNLGMMIDTQMFDSRVPTSPHEEHMIKFKKRS